MDIGEWLNNIRGKRVLIYMMPRFKEDVAMITGTFVVKSVDIFLDDFVMYDGNDVETERGKHCIIKGNCWKSITCK